MRTSIRRRGAVILISLTVIPLLLVGVILVVQSYSVQQQQAFSQQSQVAQRVSAQVSGFIRGLESELAVVAQVRDLFDLDREQQQSILSELLSHQDSFEELTLLDSQGQEQVRLSRLKIITPDALDSRAGADEFVTPQASGEVYYSPVRFDEVSGEPLMTIALPLQNARTGLVDGVLVADVRFKPIWDLIASVQLEEGENVYVVDAQGQVTAHRNPSVVLRGTSFALPDQDGIQDGLDGTSVVLATDAIPLGDQQFTIIAEKATAQAMALTIRTVLTIAFAIVVALVAASLLVTVAMRGIVQPIEELATSARAISAGDLSQRVVVTSQDEIGALATAFNSMTDQLSQTLTGLERQVAERTRGLQAAAEVSRATTAVLDLDDLLRQVVELVRERFDLYYVGLFLVDEEGQFAVLRAGTGEAGQTMMAQAHRLTVGGGSMIGQCVSEGRAAIALDVGEEAVRFDNPLLPGTRSEMALPLLARGQVLGAMTVQDIREAAFGEADIAVMQTMADQVAVAIDNARLFAETQAALEEMEGIHQRYLGEAWAEYVGARTGRGFIQTQAGIAPLAAEDVGDVRERGESSSTTLITPIVQRDQPLGVLGLSLEEGKRQWTAEEVTLAETIAEQFALAADNLRLLEDSQRRAARERMIGEVATRMRESLEMEALLRTAASEMRQAMDLDDLVIRLAVPGTDGDPAQGETSDRVGEGVDNARLD